MLWPMGAVSTALSRMSTVGFPWMSLDHSSLLAQASIRKPRRPVAEEMLSLRIRDDRPLVEVNQQPIRLPQMGDSLSLLWRWRSGGCLGPEAAVALNARQRQPGRTGPQQQTPPPAGPTGGLPGCSALGLPSLLLGALCETKQPREAAPSAAPAV